MATSLRMRSNSTSDNTSQERLRAMLARSPAASRFQALFGTSLMPFVGKILEVFEAPMAEGGNFQFSKVGRTAFLNLIDPSSVSGRIGPKTFVGPAQGKMVPDDPGAAHPDRVWRKLASAVSAGISYREPGLHQSLHIALRLHGADVHLDREGFLADTNGRVTYDPRQVLNHLSADLLSDHVALMVSSLTVRDPAGKTRFQATAAPWLEVNLPGTADIGGSRSEQTEKIVGIRLFGVF